MRNRRFFNRAGVRTFHRWGAEKLNSARHDFGALPLAAVVLCFEVARAETPLDVNVASLL